VISARISSCQSEKSRIPIFSGDLIFKSRYLASRTVSTSRSREASVFLVYVVCFDPEDGSSTFLFYRTTRHHMSDDNILHSHHSECLKPNKTQTLFILNTTYSFHAQENMFTGRKKFSGSFEVRSTCV
jgi:hypothetical protein